MGLRILIINDDVDLLEACSLVLQFRRVHGRNACAGNQSFGMGRPIRSDVVLLDWVLTETRGDIVFRQLRNRYGPSRPRIILMSALPELHRLALELGADGYLQKPFNDDQLVAAIQTNLDRAPEMTSQ
jgi:two-component system, OmpR family, response regulator CpxR